uniref:Protein TEX261 n=1 Tax=Eucampia antarctica TaxID=49252 RepID=A0A7S2RLB4_9STRA|mmetsp:Transcript_23730/g.22762  ORF Transcript_23730/g.22762 Transcript_23730/m.22762 type:complete len:206 (+) Transcript_23730:12-629(+)
MGFLFDAISWISGAVALIMQALSLAAGLYVLCELAEEYASVGRRWLNYSLVTVISLYLLLWLDGGLPFIRVAFGIFAHLLYVPHLRNFPVIEPLSISAIMSVVAAIVNHVVWFQFLLVQYPPLSALSHFGFLLVFVWLVPLGFFVSLTTPDDCLPSKMASAGMMGDPMRNGAFANSTKQKNILKSIIDFFVERIMQLLPGRGKRQ